MPLGGQRVCREQSVVIMAELAATDTATLTAEMAAESKAEQPVVKTEPGAKPLKAEQPAVKTETTSGKPKEHVIVLMQARVNPGARA